MVSRSHIESSVPSVRADPFSASLRCIGHLHRGAQSLMIALLAVPISILTARKVQRALIAILVLNVSLQIQKHFFLREDLADLGALGGLQISLTSVALAGLYSAWLLRLATSFGPVQSIGRTLNRVTLPGLLFLAFCLLSLLVAVDAALGIFEVCSVLERFLLYLYIAKAVTSREAPFMVRVLLLALVIQSALMLAQGGGLLGDIDVYGIKTRATFAGDPRISGTVGSPILQQLIWPSTVVGHSPSPSSSRAFHGPTDSLRASP